MKIGDFIWHPCSLDIIKHKIISIREFKDFKQYVLKAVKPVGACGRIMVIVSVNKGRLTFVELMGGDSMTNADGLQDFIEGKYYTDEKEAKLAFYEIQRLLHWSNVIHKKRLYQEAKINYDRVKLLINTLKTENE